MERPTWSNKLEYHLSLFSYVIGLSASWRFPYLALENNGGLFLTMEICFNSKLCIYWALEFVNDEKITHILLQNPPFFIELTFKVKLLKSFQRYVEKQMIKLFQSLCRTCCNFPLLIFWICFQSKFETKFWSHDTAWHFDHSCYLILAKNNMFLQLF